MKPVKICIAAATLACLSTSSVIAQEAGGTAAPTVPAPSAGTAPDQQKLPEVQVIQEKQKPAPASKKTTKKVKTTAAPQVQPGPPSSVDPTSQTTAQGPAPNFVIPPPPADVKISPLPGSEMPVGKIPYTVNTLSSADIARDHSVITQDVLNNRIPGVVVDDLQGNSFQTGVQYRGFEASPVNGLPQGLAVYQNGVRINEAFGDTVNWDFLPDAAIADITVMSTNPIFGLNAIGGAVNITMKDGFNFHGADVDTRFGSFGRKQVSSEAGMQSGNWAAYGAFEAIDDDGFRDFSSATERRGYLDLGVRGDGAEFHFNSTIASNQVGVTAAVPEELLNFAGRSRTFTSPQVTDNDMQMYSLNGVVQVTPQTAVSGVTYYRHFKQSHIDGNISEFDECPPGTPGGSELCTEDGAPLFGLGKNGALNPITDLDQYGVLGSIDKTGQNADSFGVALQAANKSDLFGHRNQFIIGSSYDHGHVAYQASSQLGSFEPKYVVAVTGPTLTGDPSLGDDLDASSVTPRSLTTLNDYFGIYFLDAFDVTDRLTVTAGGRFNYARVQIINTGEESLNALNGVNEFNRFNPSAGFTYKIAPALSFYGGYSEANRAPTASEIACSDPENPCIIESALASDPPLKQVVSRTWELGFRGQNISWSGKERFDWGINWFRTLNSDDIIQIADQQQGRGYFANAGLTQRQGVELNASYRNERWFWYGSYAFIDATYQSTNIIPSENNPKVTTECDDFGIGGGDEGGGDEDGEAMCMKIKPGDRIPGIPQHRFKAGFDYKITPKWKFGADLIAASSQFFYGDDTNVDKPLGGYTKVNLHTSYDVTDHIQVYGLIDNLFDQQYGIYGTYFNTKLAQQAGPGCGSDPTCSGASSGGGPDPSLNGLKYDPNNARTITPAIPFAAYGGIKVKF
ncbi:TonB-dependent receptor [Hyphomicrobium sp.]|uniref:TonB-dependent receptor n=1 Tax=Hyphomicrobium sp. TaxID=82 RepID=UPI000FC3C77A|nr:TonB-dependent receptor [Hyphomicrobium sp.]RUO99241.1 MAG: TonB-dependent receptor [Hyphomicrobium sp.]